MKKIIGILVLACFFAGWTWASAETSTEIPEVFYGTPVLDGEKDSIYTGEPMHVNHMLEANCTIADGSRANVWLAWDYEALYVYALVDEKTLSIVGAEEWQKDSVEVFIDEDNSKSTINDNNDKQYRVSASGSHSNGISAPSDFEGVAKTNDDGTYSVELKCCWHDILPADDLVIGFDVQVNDANDKGQRVSCVTWQSDSTECYVNSTSYGNIKLKLGDAYKKWNGKDVLKISVNSYKVIFDDVNPTIVEDRVLVPMRKIFELLDADVAWNEENRSVYVIGNGKLMIMPIGSSVVTVNDEEYICDVPIQIINERTMVPIRFVSEMLGAQVNYDSIQGAVFINSNNE
ncbi:MAG: sugar-binding protein [Clostridiales bacterium]|nr:sugar-binding protein [Clostridiales bacterium]